MATRFRALLFCIASLELSSLALAGGAGCPQQRTTAVAPAELAVVRNPLPASRANLRAGRALYLGGDAVACVSCHGRRGDGNGRLAGQFTPAPRNFRCEAMAALPDGQLFWVIRSGSPATSMPAHPALSDEQVWQLVHYLRQFRP